MTFHPPVRRLPSQPGPEPDSPDQDSLPGSAGSEPQPDRCQGAELLVWGAHGGAGTTTLATWLGPSACDLGSMRADTDPRYPAQLSDDRPLVVVCGSSARAALAATLAVKAVTMAWSRVTVLAIVGDGWPEPSTATIRFHLLERQVDEVIRVPFVPGMRLADEPSAVPLPRQARRAVSEIRAAVGLPPISPNVPDLPDRS